MPIRAALGAARRRYHAERHAVLWAAGQDTFCRACGGIGYLDEQDAADLGLELNGRTEKCFVCRGSGAGADARFLAHFAGLGAALAALITSLRSPRP